MSDVDGDPDVTELLADLTRSLQELQTEIEPDRRLRPPTPGELSRFTSEVAIPGIILVLETNIRALKLLQRAIRLADGKEPRRNNTVSEARDRAESLSRATLSQLESTLSDVQSAVEDRPDNEQTEQLLDEARSLRDQIQTELERRSESREGEKTGASGSQADDSTESEVFEDEPVDIDVEAELKSIKDNLDDTEDGSNGNRPSDSDSAGSDESEGPGEPGDDSQSDNKSDPDQDS